MLVLSRKRDEAITIDDRIEIRVLEIRGKRVRLGLIAPREISIQRHQVYERINGKPFHSCNETTSESSLPAATS